ncbi:N-alpha-acetyltransferase 16, NatA auxiliary subunit [Drosophila miranda]|uniref:N-alpha-acetyltransferase 16, NatA auxiliary subunit n=1 Tax=Drosophila miranda TaxID=7229 RepID=UPI0007E6F4E4|nr:N-alpha-acetyltransferase 16, NatA auxiliary subunit [Drosophila miranda]XP_017152314.1 N-alpha-acetyltransferase 16, NatA auxiliary subunit [Drosophila miranda]
MPSSDPLPPKEGALFRKLLKCYELKQYKNGLKLAKQILSNPKYMEHGETLAMKGLTLNGLGRREEAYKYVRLGLRNDLRSHVCWHVYGLLQRSDKKYDEAIKCYRNALKWEKDNLQILKDLSLLQIQMRDLEGYKETRHHLFTLRPSQHASWIGFAMSYHLLRDYEMANNILETFSQSQTSIEAHDYRHSELLLYQNQILIESSRLEQALDHLNKYNAQIVDKLAVRETMGDLYIKLRQHDLAVPIFESLIRRNPENVLYYEQYLSARQVSESSAVVAVYREFQEKYPRALCPRRLPLNVASGSEFRTVADEYLRRGLRKGIPPLFVNVRTLHQESEKATVIEKLTLDYFENLTRSGHFSREDADAGAAVEPASALVWTALFLAQHYDYMRDTDRALDYINVAIDHTPTLIELLITKGRIFKHAGDAVEAYVWLEEAQSMDTADRYINSKCAKYMLRANLVQEAEEICAKFTREGVSAMDNLNEMQCMWFQTECALAYQRMGRWGESLKKCHEVERHFAEIVEDQFDFHTYCMRKMTLRAYVGLLRLEDVLRQHPFYFKASKCAIEVYLHLYDKPLKSEAAIEEIGIENLPPSELKKLRSKQRKAKKKAELESAQAAQAQVKREQHQKSKQQASQETDPDAPQLDELVAEKLERTDEPLERAIDFLKPLQQLAKERIETHLLAFEVYYRKNKPLLMLQSIQRARAVNSAHPEVHSCIIRFMKSLSSALKQQRFNEHVQQVLDKATKELIGSKTLQQLNDEFIAKHNASILHLYEGARSLFELDPSKKDTAIKLVTNFNPNKLRLEEAIKVYTALRDGDVFGECEEETAAYQQACQQRFQYARIFRNIEELEAQLQEKEAAKLRAEEEQLQLNHVDSSEAISVSATAVTAS